MHALNYVLCDVFTDRPFAGNQLAVFTNATKVPDAVMQSLAREFNFSECVFVQPSANAHARLRIFTPKREIAFAGHPTLGAAFVLAGPLSNDLLKLETGAGIVEVRIEREGPRIVFASMAQPLPVQRPFESEGALLAALGLDRCDLPVTAYDNGLTHLLCVVDTPTRVAALTPDFRQLRALGTFAVSVAALDGDRLKTRMFAPSLGVDEDPATGSAAGPLAVHLAQHGRWPFGRELTLDQGAELGRPSVLVAKVQGSPERVERVEVGGCAVVLGRGAIQLSL